MEYSSKLHQAVSLALCLVEWEIERPTGPGTDDWRADLATARDTLQAAHNVLERARPAPDYKPSQSAGRGPRPDARLKIQAMLEDNPAARAADIAKAAGVTESYVYAVKRKPARGRKNLPTGWTGPSGRLIPPPGRRRNHL